MARARQYEAFISYSHAADSALATELQRALNRIARPSYKWWQWWPPRVFRDQTNLAAATDLGARIEDALLGSDAFVLLASPLAAAEPVVDREVATWCARKPLDRIFIALTEGSLEWDDDKGDFDHARSTALPPSLRGAFDTEPLWVDFSAVREIGRSRAIHCSSTAPRPWPPRSAARTRTRSSARTCGSDGGHGSSRAARSRR